MLKTICFIVPNIYPCVTGGIELFHYYFVQFINKYYSIFLCTTCKEIESTAGVHIIKYPPTILTNQTIASVLFQLKLLFKYRRKIDLIHLPYSSKSFFQNYQILLAKKVLGIPYILRIHGGSMHLGKPFLFHDCLFKNAAGIIAVSTPIKEEYEKRHCVPITRIPSMLPFKRDPRSSAKLRELYGVAIDSVVILFLGTIKKIKGPDILLEAIFRIGLEYLQKCRVTVLFVGDGPLKVSLQTRVAELGFSEQVHFLGQVRHENVPAFYKLANMFVIPSLVEARPLTLSEAFFNLTAAIGSDISTISNIIVHNESGLLFRKGDSEDLARKIGFLIEHPEVRERLGERAGQGYRNVYKYENMVGDYCSFYNSILNKL